MTARGKRLESLLKEAVARSEALSPEEQRRQRREQAISFAYGNLSLVRGWSGTRADVERAFDNLYGEKPNDV